MNLEQLIASLKQSGPRQFAAWNADAFECYLDGPLSNLRSQLQWRDKKTPHPESLANFVRLIHESVGAGWLSPRDEATPSTLFLEHLLWTVLPHQLGNVPAKSRADVISRVWNLAEGLAHEPLWLNQYVIARTDWSTDLATLDQKLIEILAPVLSPMSPSNWTGTFQVQVLKLREHLDEFLPGRMFLAAPSLLCVENRLDPAITLAVLLQKEGRSEVLGQVGKLPEYFESLSAPDVVVSADAITINGSPVAAPLIAAHRQTLCVSSGFVAVIADDSQRVWLVEAA